MVRARMRTAIISSRTISLLCELVVAVLIASTVTAQEAPFQSRQITPAGEYTFGIEGPAVDAKGINAETTQGLSCNLLMA